MNSDNPRRHKQSGSYNWKGVIDFVKEEAKSSTIDWPNEKQILAKKISDLEKEVKVLKKTNQDLLHKVGSGSQNSTSQGTYSNNYYSTGIPLNGINLNPSLTLDRKLIAEKLLHRRGDSDKLIIRDVDKLSQFRMKIVKSKQNSDESDVLKKICNRKTKSFGGFEKLIENKLLETNSTQNKYATNYVSNNINAGAPTNKIFNGGIINISNYTTAINNVSNNIGNSISTLSISTTIADELNQGFNSSRTIYNCNQNNMIKTISSSRLADFTKVISNSLSEKDEESSIATQETIEKRPNNFLNTSNSFSQNISTNTANVTSNSNETKILNDKIINEAVSAIPDQGVNRFSSNKQTIRVIHPPDSQNDLRKSVNSMYSSNTNIYDSSGKTSHNPICVLKSHFDAVRDVYLTPDRQTLVSVGEDMLINYWDFANCFKQSKDNLIEPYFSLRTHTTPIFNLTGPNSNNLSNSICTIYSSGIDGVIRYNRILPIDYDRTLSTEEIYSKISLQPWRAHQDMIWHLDCHPNQSLVSSVSSDGTVKIFKTFEENSQEKFYYSNKSKSKNIIKTLTFKNHNHNLIEIPTHSAWSTNVKNQIYVSYTTPYIKLFDVELGKSVIDHSIYVDKNIPFENQQVNKLLFHETSNLLISGHDDRQIKFFDPHQNKLVKSLIAHTDGVSALSPTNKEYEFLSGSHDGSMRCWDLRIFKLLYDIPAHRKKYDEGCLSIRSIKEKNLIITTGADGLIKIFKLN